MNTVYSKKTWWEFFIDNKKFTYVLLLAITVLGVFSIFQIPKESEPDIDIPIAVITVPYFGASSETIEQQVIKKIEDRLIGLEGVESVESSAQTGMGMVIAQFDINADVEKKVSEVREIVAEVKPLLPQDASDPIVSKINVSDSPVLVLSVSGPYELEQLLDYANMLQNKIERVSGVSKVDVLGAPEKQIQVLVDDRELEKYNIPLFSVSAALQRSQANLPIGTFTANGSQYAVQLNGMLHSVADIENIPVGMREDVPILIKDIARVEEGFATIHSISRFSIDGKPAQTAISMRVYKASGGNILDTVDAIRESIDTLIDEQLPNDVLVETVEDNAQFIREDLGSLTTNGLQTVALVMILLFVFLGWREAILAGIAMPLTFLITFTFLSALGYTLNFLTLFSLILALGILVDGAIVVTEGMYTQLKNGQNPREAARLTIREFKTPLISGTLTTVFAFLPMMLTSGLIGKFIQSIPVTVSIVLMASLFVALSIITTLGMTFLKRKNTQTNMVSQNMQTHVSLKDRLRNSVQGWYAQKLSALFISRTKRVLLYVLMVVLFASSLLLPIFGILKVNMFPQPSMDTVYIDISRPVDTTLTETNKTVEQVEKILQSDTRVVSFSSSVGSGSNAGGAGQDSSGSNIASIIVNLDPDREENSSEIIDEYTQTFKDQISDRGKISVSQLGTGPQAGSPVEMQISGPSFEELEKLAYKYKALFEEVPGTTGVDTSIKEARVSYIIEIDRIKAQLYGLDVMQIAQVLRNAVSGATAITIAQDGVDKDVIVRYMFDDTKEEKALGVPQIDINDIKGLTVSTIVGNIPLTSFATISLEASNPVISHTDGKRTVRVYSNLEDGYVTGEVVSAIEERMKDEIELPEDYTVTFGGESADINQSFSDLFRAMILGIFMIAALLVWQFRSFRQPIFILMTIPLALIGILPGLVIVNQPLSFPGFIGVVALAGIVVNNAIILVDSINRNRLDGFNRSAAIIQAGVSRLQPIILTTITTVSGILPLAITNESWGPLAYSIVFGLVFSTVLTLFVVPSLYFSFGEKTLE